MHEKKARLFCRIILLVCCIAPTVAIAGWTGFYRLTGHVAQYDRVASKLLGARVAIARVDYPTPLVTVLHDIQVNDPETRQLLLQVDQLTLRRGYGKLSLDASTVTLQAERLTRLWQLLDRDLFRWSEERRNPISLAVKEIQLNDGTDFVHTIHNTEGHIKQNASGLELVVKLPVEGVETEAPPQLRVTREKRSGQVITVLDMHTGTRLPARLFAWRYPVLGVLGDDCIVQAVLRADLTENGWAGKFEALFSQIDLARLTESYSDTSMSGTVNLHFEKLQFAPDQVSFSGTIVSTEPGQIDTKLLGKFRDRLGMQVSPNYLREQRVAYQQLQARFTFDKEGLSISGDCPSAPQGVAINGSNGWIAGSSTGQVPIDSLVRKSVPKQTRVAMLWEMLSRQKPENVPR